VVLSQVVSVNAQPVVVLDQAEPVLIQLADGHPARVEVIEYAKFHARGSPFPFNTVGRTPHVGTINFPLQPTAYSGTVDRTFAPPRQPTNT
jgi:hypothetical protein